MKFELDPLPYPKNALEPHIGARTLEFHYEKHHKGYLSKLQAAIGGKPQANDTLEAIVVGTKEPGIFNLAAQVWNHTFYWNSMSPRKSAVPAALQARIDQDLGGVDACKKALADAANGQFGSGWAWLIENANGKLEVCKTGNAGNPLTDKHKPLLTIDVWEHAYYLDTQNDRAAYVQRFLDHLINWQFAAANLNA